MEYGICASIVIIIIIIAVVLLIVYRNKLFKGPSTLAPTYAATYAPTTVAPTVAATTLTLAPAQVAPTAAPITTGSSNMLVTTGSWLGLHSDAVPSTMLSPDGTLLFKMQSDGNAVLSRGGSPIWSTNTGGQTSPPYLFWLQGGQLQVYQYNNGNILWRTNTSTGVSLTLSNTGLVLADASGQTLWSAP